MLTFVLILLTIFTMISLLLLLSILKRTGQNPQTDINTNLKIINTNQEKLERTIRDEITTSRTESISNSRKDREELSNTLKGFNETLTSNMNQVNTSQKNQLDTFSNQLITLTQSNEQKLEGMRMTIEGRLKMLQDDNSKKLEQMRETVDEKLHNTLEKRLGESFKQVSDRLEQVHKGLGEMQTLAVGVGDLKKVLSNVKTRGIWGEIQLGNLLEQMLSPEQYATNVKTKAGNNEIVEFAIKLPGRDDKTVWLPVDSKFPVEDYQRLVDASEQGNVDAITEASAKIEISIKKSAKDIHDKYIDPPNTTDFGIMFLPIEGLYAEVIKRPGLTELLQREYRVAISGPTTFTALLNTLQMGFRTLAIEKRTSEVWQLLSAVKTDFSKFADLLEQTQKKLLEASHKIEDAARKSRTIERKLKDVQELPNGDVKQVLDFETEVEQ